MNKKLLKFDNPKRIAELSPESTLLSLGVNDNSVIFDYGAGTGVFFAACCKDNKQHGVCI